jgi:hypothetical protein
MIKINVNIIKIELNQMSGMHEGHNFGCVLCKQMAVNGEAIFKWILTTKNYSRILLRSLSRDQRIRDFLSGKTYEEGKVIKSNRIVTS